LKMLIGNFLTKGVLWTYIMICPWHVNMSNVPDKPIIINYSERYSKLLNFKLKSQSLIIAHEINKNAMWFFGKIKKIWLTDSLDITSN
jgi:hypothetical protein